MGVLTPQPCVPVTTMPWVPGSKDVLVKGQPALMDDCKLQCMWAGSISFITDGHPASKCQTGASGGGSTEIKHYPKCYGIFRPHDVWEGEYGFDWVRFKDEKIKTKDNNEKGNDYDTKELLGKYLSNACATKRANCASVNTYGMTCPAASHKYCININSWSDVFEKDSAKPDPAKNEMYKKLKSTFFNDTYSKYWDTNHGDTELMEHTPTLTVLKGKTIKLSLRVYRKIISKKKGVIDPANLVWKYDHAFFNITATDINVSKINEGDPKDFSFTLECKNTFEQNQIIEIELDGMICGKLLVLANDDAHRRIMDAVLIKIRVDIGNGEKVGIFNGGIDTIKNILNQAYVSLKEDTEVTFNIGSLDPVYINSATHEIKFNGNLLTYLNNRVKNELDSKYASYFKVYALDEVCEGGTLGFSVPGTDSCIVFNGHNNSTASHELLHSLGLPHTFVAEETSENGKYTFEALKTENVMDYSHWNNLIRRSTFHWQWKIMNNKIN